MKSWIKRHLIPYGTDEWYEFRKRGIGSSEIGSVLYLSPYSPAVKVFYEKLGLVEPFKVDNEATFHGRNQEDYVARMWMFYDGKDPLSYIFNYNQQNIQRRCINPKGYFVNPNFPHLFVSPDRIIRANQFTLPDFAAHPNEAVLECKTISGWASKMWADGVPLSYTAQVQMQMLVLEMDYCEIALLEDGRKLRVIPMRKDKELAEAIERMSRHFWFERVEKARPHAERIIKGIGTNEDEAIIQTYEPEAEESEAYSHFMSDKFKVEQEFMLGTDADVQTALRHKAVTQLRSGLDKQASLLANGFIKRMSDERVERIDLPGENGYVRYSISKNSKYRTFNNYIKKAVSITPDAIQDMLAKLDEMVNQQLLTHGNEQEEAGQVD